MEPESPYVGLVQPRIGITASPTDRDGLRVQSLTTSYTECVEAGGGLPLIIPVMRPELVETALDAIDGLLLSGGGDIDPRRYGQEPVPEVDGVDDLRDEWELALVDAAYARDIPILAICRGTQVLNVAAGGTLIQDIPSVSEHPHREQDRFDDAVHQVSIEPDSLLAHITGAEPLGVNTLHHQAIDEVGRGLRVVARADDDGLVEAVEATDGHRALGVQWHPELLARLVRHAALFSWLVDEARRDAVARLSASEEARIVST